ncbi:MAG: hypothetical protein EB084_16535 [Proteobacteria bacterium]|nr:hypothetical protein [Pseudomonadota bacterium]
MTAFQQVYYTSCESGTRGGKGFQIQAHSENMSAPLLRSVEQLASYSAPRSSPTRPSPEEIERFPVSLTYQRLSDGTPVIARNRYVGRDYSGRFGNFFMHALVAAGAENAQLPVMPVALWDASFWRHESDVGTSKTLALQTIEPRGFSIDLDAIAAFAREGGRQAWISRFVGAVETALTTGRRIIVVDTDANVAAWVRLACSVLPDALSHALTFDTYARSPYERDVLLVGTRSDSDFRFSPHELEYQFFVFDLEGTRSTRELPETPFSRLVASALAERRFEVMAGFPAFVRENGFTIEPSTLSSAATYFAVKSGLRVESPESAKVLTWCASHLAVIDGDTLRDACRMLLARCSDPDETAQAACTLMRACEASGGEAVLRAIREAFVPWMFEVVNSGRDVAWVPSLLAGAPPLVHDYSASVLFEMRGILEACRDVQRCCLLFEVLERIGALQAPSMKSRDLGAQKIGLLLSDADGRAFVGARAGLGKWSEFFGGAVAACEQSLAKTPTLSADWKGLLSDAKVRAQIQQVAVDVRASTLLTEMGRLGVADGSADPARELEVVVRAQQPREAREIAALYDRFFGEKAPTLHQAQQVARLFEGRTVEPQTYKSLGQPLVEVADLRSDLERASNLGSVLLALSAEPDVPQVTSAAAAACLLSYMKNHPHLLRPAQIFELERHLRWLPDAFVKAAAFAVAEALLSACTSARQDWETVRCAFDACVSAFGRDAFCPLFAYVFRRATGTDEKRTIRFVACVFAIWATARGDEHHDVFTYIKNELLVGVCRQQRGGFFEAVVHEIGRVAGSQGGNDAPHRFDRWAQPYRPSFVHRMFGRG